MTIRMGERKRGSTVLPARAQFGDGDTLGCMQRTDGGAIPKSLSPLHFSRCHRAALYAARRWSVPMSVSQPATSGA